MKILGKIILQLLFHFFNIILFKAPSQWPLLLFILLDSFLFIILRDDQESFRPFIWFFYGGFWWGRSRYLHGLSEAVSLHFFSGDFVWSGWLGHFIAPGGYRASGSFRGSVRNCGSGHELLFLGIRVSLAMLFDQTFKFFANSWFELLLSNFKEHFLAL